MRQRGGSSFGETGLEPMLDLVVECDGTIVEGRLLLVDRIGVSTQGPPGLDTPAPGAPPKSARAAKRRRIQGD